MIEDEVRGLNISQSIGNYGAGWFAGAYEIKKTKENLFTVSLGTTGEDVKFEISRSDLIDAFDDYDWENNTPYSMLRHVSGK